AIFWSAFFSIPPSVADCSLCFSVPSGAFSSFFSSPHPHNANARAMLPAVSNFFSSIFKSPFIKLYSVYTIFLIKSYKKYLIDIYFMRFAKRSLLTFLLLCPSFWSFFRASFWDQNFDFRLLAQFFNQFIHCFLLNKRCNLLLNILKFRRFCNPALFNHD